MKHMDMASFFKSKKFIVGASVVAVLGLSTPVILAHAKGDNQGNKTTQVASSHKKVHKKDKAKAKKKVAKVSSSSSSSKAVSSSSAVSLSSSSTVASSVASTTSQAQSVASSSYSSSAVSSSVESSKPIASSSSTSQSQNSSVVSSSSSVQQQPQTTSGFNFSGHHFNIGSYSGSGQVPTDTVYAWADLANWYLMDIRSAPASLLSTLSVGSPVTVNGHTYHITEIEHNMSHDESNATNGLARNAIGWQVCETYSYNSPLTLYFAS